MRFYEKLIPEGYEIEETDERLGSEELGFFTKFGAEYWIKHNPPTSPSYHFRVERKGFLRWKVIAYQHRLKKIGS